MSQGLPVPRDSGSPEGIDKAAPTAWANPEGLCLGCVESVGQPGVRGLAEAAAARFRGPLPMPTLQQGPPGHWPLLFSAALWEPRPGPGPRRCCRNAYGYRTGFPPKEEGFSPCVPEGCTRWPGAGSHLQLYSASVCLSLGPCPRGSALPGRLASGVILR